MKTNNAPNHGLDANQVLESAFDGNLEKLITGKAKKAGLITLTPANTGPGTVVIEPFNTACVDAYLMLTSSITNIATPSNLISIQMSPDDEGSTWLTIANLSPNATANGSASAVATLVIARRLRVITNAPLATGESILLGLMIK